MTIHIKPNSSNLTIEMMQQYHTYTTYRVRLNEGQWADDQELVKCCDSDAQVPGYFGGYSEDTFDKTVKIVKVYKD